MSPAPDFFVPDRDPPTFYPLRSYLRGVSASVAEKYIDALTAPGDLVIDPFACTPTVARVAQKMGRRALAVESNPLWAWLARTLAALPRAAETDAALARLGDTLKDDAPLRVHISQLYLTTCAACHKQTAADYFIHDRHALKDVVKSEPIQRHYTCAHCGETRDDPATEDDLKRHESFDAHGMHYHLAFERVVPPENLHADRIRKMLAVYTPRNLCALVTLTLKIDSLFHSTSEHAILRLLLLHLLDRGSSFYAMPNASAQLTAHKQFVEFNLWREIEIAARELGRGAPALELAESPVEVVESETAAAFVGRGSARSLAHALPDATAALVLATPPSRRLPVWALSYLWGAWILGREFAQPLVPFLDSKKDAVWERRWYFDSLVQSLSALAKLARSGARAAFVFNESWQQVIEALLLAAAGARFELDTFLFQPRVGESPRREFDDIRGDYRITFTPTQTLPRLRQGTELEEEIRAAALAAGTDILTRRGEPLAFSWVHHAAYARAMRAGYLARAMSTKSKMPPGQFVHNAVLAGLSEGYARDFDHYESQEQFVWLRRAPDLAAPLIDRVDDAVREILSQRESISRAELEDTIYRRFPGDLTPEAGLIDLCAAAYADERDGMWQLKVENPEADKSRALDLLARLGERLEYSVERPDRSQRPVRSWSFDLTWLSDGEIAHGFIWRDRAIFADVAQVHLAPAHGLLVVPESHVALLREKTRRQPHLADAFNEAGWDFVRVPFVEQLLAVEKLERRDVARMAGLVPPVAEERAQLELF
ncbi:MAG: hypothetical protein KGJ80_03990 [Chloroflexota bacterium]|nr:hypothetical protein [Chloroflexota bacterium]